MAKISIKDVAKHAGVSVASVSNVINQKTNVTEDIYRRVMNSIRELNYHPNLLARNLRTNKTRFIGVIFPSFEGIYSSMFEGLLYVLKADGYQVITGISYDLINLENDLLDEYVMLGVKGILIVSSSQDHNKFDEIIKKQIPVVFLERSFERKDYSSVVFDNENIIYKTVTQIAEKSPGTSIALITGNADLSSEIECLKGFDLACREKAIINKNSFSVSTNKEQIFSDILAYIGSLDHLPEHIISTKDIISRYLVETLTLFDIGSVKIYSLSGENWLTSLIKDNIRYLPRDGFKCGVEAARLLIKYLKAPLAHENVQTKIISNQPLDIRVPTAKPSLSKIRILLTANSTSETIVSLLPNFEKSLGVKVEYDILYEKELYNTIIREFENKSNRYDIYMIDLPWKDYLVDKGYLTVLNGYMNDRPKFIDSFIPEIKDTFVEDDGNIYAVPVVVGTQLILYRKDLFEDTAVKRGFFNSYGIDLAPPKTWTEYNLIAKYFTREFNRESPVTYGTCMLSSKPVGLIEEFLPRQAAYNGSILSGGKIAIDSIQNLRALKNMCTTWRYSYPDTSDFLGIDQIELFSHGDIALINTFSVNIRSVYSKMFNRISNQIGFAATPNRKPLYGQWLLGVNVYSKHIKEGYHFIDWATGDDLAILSSVIGGLVPKQTVFSNDRLRMAYPWLDYMDDYIEMSHTRESIRELRSGKPVNTYEIEEIIAFGLDESIKGINSPENALKDIQKKIIKWLKSK